MREKLVLLPVLAAVLAFAVPAFANAATGLTEGAKLIATGTTIVFQNDGNVTITSAKTGNITCSKMTLKIPLTTNSATTVAGGSGSGTASGCTVGGGTANFTSLGITSFDTTGGGTGTASVSAGVELPSGTTCKYSTSGGTGTYNPTESAEGGNKLTFTEVALSVSPAACGTTAKLDGVFLMETDNLFGTHVWLM